MNRSLKLTISFLKVKHKLSRFKPLSLTAALYSTLDIFFPFYLREEESHCVSPFFLLAATRLLLFLNAELLDHFIFYLMRFEKKGTKKKVRRELKGFTWKELGPEAKPCKEV